MSQICGKNVLITGGASGLGRHMAQKMAALGAHIIIWDINEIQLAKVAGEIKEKRGSVSTYNCDVSDRSAVHTAANSLKQDLGTVDILINNAGVVCGKPFLECTDDQIQKTMSVNVMAHFWTTRSFLPDMIRKNSGHIVTIASAGGIMGVSRQVDYAASKFAAFGLDESLRLEIKKNKWNIQTTVVCPYYMTTDMFRGVKTRFPLLLPILDANEVAEKVVQAIRKDKARVILPPVVYAVWPLRLLPVALFDAAANFLGLNKSMDTFRGHEYSPRERKEKMPE